MEILFHHIERMILEMAEHVPLELFVFVGALVEEVFAFIPSLLIMTTAGFLAQIEGHTPFFLLWLVLLGNIGKLIGSLGYYVLGDKLEDVVTGKGQRFFGLSHNDIERVGRRLTGNAWRDGAFVFLLRLVPFFPTLAVSVACGVIRVPLRTFLVASYLGNACKDLVYILFGYFGAVTMRTFLIEIERVRWGIGILITIGVIATLALLYRERHRGKRLFAKTILWFRDKLKRS